jgi:CBS domain-containing protein
MRVEQVMGAPTMAVTPGTTVLAAARYLLQREVVTLPVVGDDGRLLGVVSRSDLLRHRLFSDPGDPLAPAPTVVEVMTRQLVTLPPDADVGQAADTMGRHGIRALPVVDGGRLVGIVSAELLLARASGGTSERSPVLDVEEPARGSAKPSTGRAADRRGLVVLSLEDCLERLRSTPVGRFAFVVGGAPVMLPVNHGLDGTSVVFRTTWGSKLQVAQAAGRVAYEVDGFDPATRTGWSVLVQGVARTVYEEAEVERYERLGVASWAPAGPDLLWVQLRPDDISGRELPGT